MSKRNQGVTLIELVVTFAILTVVIGAILSFLTYSIRFYQKNSRNTDLQNEAQVTENVLANLIVNATSGVATNSITGTSTGTELTVYGYSITDSNTLIYQATRIYQNGKNLVYTVSTLAQDGNGKFQEQSVSEPEVISSNLSTDANDSNFTVDLSRLASQNMVMLSICFEMNDHTYTCDSKIKLRNEVVSLTNGTADDYFTNQADGTLTNVTSVTITPKNSSLWQGETGTFTSSVSTGSNTYTGRALIWKITGANNGTTINSSTGAIDVSKTQTGNLTVQAFSQDSINAANGDTTKFVSATTTIVVKELNSIKISGLIVTEKPSQAAVTVTITGKNFDADNLNEVKLSPRCGTLEYSILNKSALTNSLTYSVIVKGPASASSLGPYELTATAGAGNSNKTITASLENIIFKASTEKTITAVELGQNDGSTVPSDGIDVTRGTSIGLKLRATYSDGSKGDWLSADQWSLSDNSQLGIQDTKSGNLRTLNLCYKQATSGSVPLTATYSVDGKAFSVATKLNFKAISVYVKGVDGQTRFFMTKGTTETMTICVSEIENYSLVVKRISDSTRMSATLSENEKITINNSSNWKNRIVTGEFEINLQYKDDTNIIVKGMNVIVDAGPLNFNNNPNWVYMPAPDKMNNYLNFVQDEWIPFYKMGTERMYFYARQEGYSMGYYLSYNNNTYKWSWGVRYGYTWKKE